MLALSLLTNDVHGTSIHALSVILHFYSRYDGGKPTAVKTISVQIAAIYEAKVRSCEILKTDCCVVDIAGLYTGFGGHQKR